MATCQKAFHGIRRLIRAARRAEADHFHLIVGEEFLQRGVTGNLSAFSWDRAVAKSRHGDESRARVSRQKLFDLMAVGSVKSDAEFFHEINGQNLQNFENSDFERGGEGLWIILLDSG
jgi:hypothetical protein